MVPRSIAFAALGLAVIACSSAPPKDEPIPTIPDREVKGTEPVNGSEDPQLQGEEAPAPLPETAEPEPEEPLPPGTTCTANCTTEGAKRCATSTSYEVCKMVVAGCLRWTTAKACGAAMSCTAGTCSCDHQCTLDTNSCTSPTQFKTCVKNANGCRVWSAPKSCVRAVPSPGCYAYGSACFGTCKDTCSTEGSVTCSGPTSYVECVRGSDQCLKVESGSCKTSSICFSDPKVCANGT